MEKMPENTLLALHIANVRAGFTSPIVALGQLAREGYSFVGGIKQLGEHKPGYRQSHLDLNIGEWVYNVAKGAERTVTYTNIGSIAILSGLFGNLDFHDELYIYHKGLTKKSPPYYGWKEVPQLHETARPQFKHFVRPELITKAQLYPEQIQGNIHIVKANPEQTEYIGQGIHSSFDVLKTLGVVPVNGTALFNFEVEPDNFEDIRIPYLEPRDKQS